MRGNQGVKATPLVKTEGSKTLKGTPVILCDVIGLANLSSHRTGQKGLSKQLPTQLFKCLVLQATKAPVSLWHAIW
jgi:hypothetical protein